MGRVIAMVIGGLLIAVGVIALVGAAEILRAGGNTEDISQAFLVPVSLFVVGGFVIWMGSQSGKS